ncbi:MAG: hypothetical protein HZB32_05260 [Nitrospirae bacterium]|nr:hypothetical protein [Nitrospirota bacterium]
MAVFLYYVFRAGQLVFYSGAGSVREEEVNVWTISILAILAGAFTEDAYARLSSIAAGFFRPKEK